MTKMGSVGSGHALFCSNLSVPELRCFTFLSLRLHGPSILAVKAKIYGVLCKQSSSIAFDETSSYWSALKSS